MEQILRDVAGLTSGFLEDDRNQVSMDVLLERMKAQVDVAASMGYVAFQQRVALLGLAAQAVFAIVKMDREAEGEAEAATLREKARAMLVGAHGLNCQYLHISTDSNEIRMGDEVSYEGSWIGYVPHEQPNERQVESVARVLQRRRVRLKAEE